MRIFFFIVFVGITLQQESFGQVVLLDSDDKTPVAYAHVVSSEGVLICFSDINGVINLKKIQSTRDNTFFIQHISYQNLDITKDSLLTGQEVLLKPRVELLPPITVRAQTSDYLVLTCYFAGYQTDDNIPKYYIDGIAEYYIPIEKKRKVKRRIIQYRVYSNKELIQKEKRRNIQISFLIGAPYLGKSIVTHSFDKKYYIRDSSTIKLITLKKSHGLAGKIWKDNNKKINRLEIDLLAPDNEWVLNLFRYTIKFTHYTITESYRYGQSDTIIKDELMSRNTTQIFTFKHKKDTAFREIKLFTNLFVLEKKYLEQSALKEVDFSLSINKESSYYSSAYWEERNIALPDYIKNALDSKKLQLGENIIE